MIYSKKKTVGCSHGSFFYKAIKEHQTIKQENCFSYGIVGLLICTLISENPGLQKSKYVSNRRKISGPANLDFFSVCHLDFFQVYSINLAFFLGRDLEKSPGLQDLKFFFGLKQTLISEDLDFQKSRCRLKGRMKP